MLLFIYFVANKYPYVWCVAAGNSVQFRTLSTLGLTMVAFSRS